MAIKNLCAECFDEVTGAPGLCLVDFWASWCGPCRMQAPILEELAMAHDGEVQVCKVDVDAEPALAERFGVMSIPTLVYFRDGRVIGKAVGVQSRAQLEAGLGL